MTATLAAPGAALIRHFESCRLSAYRDSVGVLTIGWGHTGHDVYAGLVISQAKADALFAADVAAFSTHVAALLGGHPTSQNQFDAMVSFAFNLGVGDLAGSTLMRDHMAGDFADAAKQFARWNHAGGVVLDGLTKRRAAESALYGTPDGHADITTILAEAC